MNDLYTCYYAPATTGGLPLLAHSDRRLLQRFVDAVQVLILITEHGIEMGHGHESCDACRETLSAARRVLNEADELSARLRQDTRYGRAR